VIKQLTDNRNRFVIVFVVVVVVVVVIVVVVVMMNFTVKWSNILQRAETGFVAFFFAL